MTNRTFSSLHLDAFYALCKTRHFSKAAKNINITQSALSQRIRNLEEGLNTVLFNRNHTSVELTDSAYKLLRYCEMKHRVERELLRELISTDNHLAGTIRIAGFSSIIRSVIMPSLAPLLKENPEIAIHYIISDIDKLEDFLDRGLVDFVLTYDSIHCCEIETCVIGHEKNILIESAEENCCPDTYLEHNVDDHFTRRFFSQFNHEPIEGFRRCFYHDIYGVLEGISLGLGRGVVPEHIIKERHRVKPVEGFGTYNLPIQLQHTKRAYYTKLHYATKQALIDNSKNYLAPA